MGVDKFLPLSWLCFVVLLLVGCQSNENTNDNTVNDVNVGDAVPMFTLIGTDGEEVSSASLKGQVYILTFFDTGCPDCQIELPVLQKIYDDYKGAIPMFNVPRSQSADVVKAYWSKVGLTMPFYTAKDHSLYYKFATRGIPRTYIVDGDGKVFAVLTDDPLADYATINSLLQTLIGDNEAVAADRSVKMSFRMKVPVTSTDIDNFKNEYVISHLELFFFDTETRKLAVRYFADNLVQEKDKSDSYYDITYTLPEKRVNVGVYNIFAIANYAKTPENIEDQDDFLSMVDSITYRSGIEPNIPSSGPVMTSGATALLSVDLVPWAGKSYSLSIEMERVLAKLQIGVKHNSFELSHDGAKYADINITNYKMVNLNRQYFLFQHSDNGYVVDPLFYKKTTNVSDASKFKNFYVSWFGDFTTESFASMPTAGNYGYAYILENTARSDCQKNGYSPGIVFKGAVSPVLVYIYDNETRTLKAETRPEYWSDVIYLYKFNFYGSIQAINVAGGLALDELVHYTDSQLKPYGIKQCKFNMGVYETYYTYWIRHQQSITNQMGAMDYAIVRNHFYKISVTGVSGIGDSKITPDIMRDNHPNSYEDIEVQN